MGAAPLIVTALLDPDLQARFDSERRALFPPGRTQVGAHVTLFHALPGDQLESIRTTLQAERRVRPPRMWVTGVRSLGRGAAYVIDSPELADVQRRLASVWRPWLTAQDQQAFRPHITVQNKVDPRTAAETVAILQAEFVPVATTCRGLGLWHYDGGPWAAEATFTFTGRQTP